MATKWYPVIDYITCTECGICAENCPHDVYDKAKAPTPVVANPEACIKGCRFCAHNCPADAITYVGDTGKKAKSTCCGENEDTKKAGSCCSGGGCCDDDEPEDCCCGDDCCGGDEKEPCCGGDDKESCCGGDEKESCCGGDESCCGKEESCCGKEESCCGKEESCCGGDDKTAVVEYLYLDLTTCDRCMGTDAVLDEVMEILAPALRLAGYEVKYRKTEMVTQEIALYNHFVSSPTIRVNGRDICRSVAESKCGCCGEISGTDVNCRVFEYGGKTYEVPPKEMLAEAILETLFGAKDDCGCGEDCNCGKDYEMPDNLKEFFKGKQKKAASWCKESCC